MGRRPMMRCWVWAGMCYVCSSSWWQLPTFPSIVGASDVQCKGWKRVRQQQWGVLSQTTCGSKSRRGGSYLVVTAKAVYSVCYPRLLGLSTARECIVLLWEIRVDSQASFVLDNKWWRLGLVPCKYCVCCVCVHSLYNSVHSVPTVRVCGVLAETKLGGLVPSQAENLKRKFNPVTHS